MISSKDQLHAALQRIVDQPILVVGDLILDRYIWGDVERVSPEAPVPVVDVRRSEERLGGAGNVARNLRNLGARVSLCALIGDDEEGRILLSLLEGDGIAADGVVTDRTRPSTLKTRIMSRGQQLVRIDRESRAQQGGALRESFAALVDAHVAPSKAVVLSDYGKGVISREIMGRLHQQHAQRAIGLRARPLMVDPHPANYDIYAPITMAKPNRKEAEAASGLKIVDRASALEAAHRLLKRWQSEMLVLSLGEDGLLILSGDNPDGTFMDTVAQQVFDVSGAGDAVVAIFTAAMATGASPAVAGDLANIGAGVVVSEVGTVPVNLGKLKREIDRLGSDPVPSGRG
ncbi:MAG: D-glycero-beta-D-manno-heptose-7-phosphate kinase [Proteobacteria bacterium]|nr:D-glycero-beta-D-manno-heptose-7-phosphate kinase [Pseudomonadota bacterium]